MKSRQFNEQKKKDKKTNYDLQNTTQKADKLATQTLLNTQGELGVLRKVNSTCPTSGSRRVTKRYFHVVIK